jgi:hypothetical protein
MLAERWQLLDGGKTWRFHTKAVVHLLVEHPKLDAFIDRLGGEPSAAERVGIMRDEMEPWLYDYVPAVAIGSTQHDRRLGAEGGRLAAHPRPHGFTQLGVREPRPIARRRPQPSASGGRPDRGRVRLRPTARLLVPVDLVPRLQIFHVTRRVGGRR